MCTLAFAWQVFADAPLVVAANRDERVGRPSQPPGVIEDDPRIVAPRDERAGGTWIGYNEHGVFVAITNRWVRREGERSRGLLVVDALGHGSAEDAARHVEEAVEEDRYAGFNLVVVDEAAALYLEYDGRLSVRPLDPGVHVVVNVGADGDYVVPPFRQEAGEQQAENAEALRATLVPEPGEASEEWLERAAGAVRDHEFGVCVHGDGFGTRSSSLLAFGDDGSVRYEFADGPPCETAYEPVEAGGDEGQL